jgi:hypothetical protein
MFSILFILVGLLAIIVSFWSPLWSWLILCVAEAVILFTFMGVKSQKWKHIPELSAPANQMLQKYGHFYTMPFAARDFSSSASAYQLASIVLGIICGFKGAWWGVAVAVVNMGLMAYVSRAFNPTVFITDPFERLAHEEVISYVMSRQGRANEP